jgi:hypothetical protein
MAALLCAHRRSATGRGSFPPVRQTWASAACKLAANDSVEAEVPGELERAPATERRPSRISSAAARFRIHER